MFDTHMINIGVKGLSRCLGEDFTEVCTIIAKQRGTCFQFDICLVIIVYVIENVIQYGFSGGATL